MSVIPRDETLDHVRRGRHAAPRGFWLPRTVIARTLTVGVGSAAVLAAVSLGLAGPETSPVDPAVLSAVFPGASEAAPVVDAGTADASTAPDDDGGDFGHGGGGRHGDR